MNMNWLENNNTLDSLQKINDGQYINSVPNNNQIPKSQKSKEKQYKNRGISDNINYLDISFNWSYCYKSNINNYRVILNSVYNAVTKALKDDYFNTSRVTMDGKRLTKTVLNIND